MINVDLIPQSKDDVIFNWLASTKLNVNSKEAIFLFCTVALRGFGTMGQQAEELKLKREACTTELQRLKVNLSVNLLYKYARASCNICMTN